MKQAPAKPIAFGKLRSEQSEPRKSKKRNEKLPTEVQKAKQDWLRRRGIKEASIARLMSRLDSRRKESTAFFVYCEDLEAFLSRKACDS